MAYDAFIAKLIHLDAGHECPIHVAAAMLKADTRGVQRIVSGRGANAEEAEERCLAEAVERHAAVFAESHRLSYASLDELGTTALDPRAMVLISDAQYELAPDWNATVEADHRLPARFDIKAKVGWVAARRADASQEIHVPAACVFLGYPDAVGEGFPVPDSSGLAAGDTTGSALDRALMELIERDAVSIWWYGRVLRPELQINTNAIPSWNAYERWVGRIGRQFWLLDLTHDLGVPVAAAISCNAQGRDLSFGFASGPGSTEAAISAMGELVQFDLTKRLQARNTLHPAHLLNWCASAAIEDHAFLRPDGKSSPSSKPSFGPAAALSNAGLTPLLVELPMVVDDVHVVRAIVPGLRPIWPRFAPGRLYDIPFQLGWHSYKLTETELNPVSILY